MKKSFLLVMFIILTAVLCFTGVAFADDSTDLQPDGSIPVVYLTIDESQGTIDDMIASPDHSVYCFGTIRIDVPDGFTYSDFPATVLEDLSETGMQIRGRGNSTWLHAAKKPFKIKLESKADIFGLGANKHWVLLANAMDPTLIHNRVTGVLIDGKALVRDKDYTAVKGSTVVTIKVATLKSLSEGSHKVTVTFDDGKVETELRITPKDDKGADPKTGDTTNFMWFAVMLMALSGLWAVLKKRQKDMLKALPQGSAFFIRLYVPFSSL